VSGLVCARWERSAGRVCWRGLRLSAWFRTMSSTSAGVIAVASPPASRTPSRRQAPRRSTRRSRASWISRVSSSISSPGVGSAGSGRRTRYSSQEHGAHAARAAPMRIEGDRRGSAWRRITPITRPVPLRATAARARRILRTGGPMAALMTAAVTVRLIGGNGPHARLRAAVVRPDRSQAAVRTPLPTLDQLESESAC
jgi:hypothetical protein